MASTPAALPTRWSIRRITAIRIIDYPASYHDGAAGITFMDGHAEIHKWLDPRTKPVPQYNNNLKLVVASPGNGHDLAL